MITTAIFDVDGTLIAGKSMERDFISFLWRYGELRFSDLCRIPSGALMAIGDGRSIVKANKAYLKTRNIQKVHRLAQDFFDQEVRSRLLRPAIERIARHREDGHTIVLVSGTPDFLLGPLADFLGIKCRVGTAIGIENDHLTGRILGLHPYGQAKVSSLLSLKGGFDLSKSYAYGNDYADRHLLKMVGNPVAANPDRRLRRLARDLGWRIEDFTR